MMKPIIDICINHGCTSPRHSSGSKAKGDKLRPYCGRCHLALSGKKTYKEGVTPVKKNYCENSDGRFGFVCATHGEELLSCQLDMDHIHPESQGGENVPENIQTVCKNCHSRKTKENGDGRIQTSKTKRTYVRAFRQDNGHWTTREYTIKLQVHPNAHFFS